MTLYSVCDTVHISAVVANSDMAHGATVIWLYACMRAYMHSCMYACEFPKGWPASIGTPSSTAHIHAAALQLHFIE